MNRKLGQMCFIKDLFTKLMIFRYNNTIVEPYNSLMIVTAHVFVTLGKYFVSVKYVFVCIKLMCVYVKLLNI
jgi:hypothetical protein